MKFTTLEIENFGRIEHAAVHLDDRGLVLIQGENLDDPSAVSNGAGKSTIVEAISWVLYGKTAKGTTGDAVIRREAKKNCSVKISIQDGEDTYTITRGRKHKTFKSNVFVQKGEDDLTKGTDKLTQEIVDKIIGCPHEVFTAAIYAGQEAMPDLPSMTDKQIKMLIEEAAGITHLDKAYDIALSRAREIATELETARRQEERADVAVEHARQRLEDGKQSVKVWNAERETRIVDLEADARIQINEAKAHKESLLKLKPLKELQDALAKTDESKSRLDVEARKRDELSATAAAQDRAHSKAQAHLEAAVRDVKRARAHKEELESQIGLPCETCGREHDETSLKSAITATAKKLSEYAGALRERKQQLEDAQTDAQSARESLDAYVRGMTDPTTLGEHRAKIQQQINERQRVEDKVNSAKSRAQSIIEAIKREKEKTNPYAAQLEELNAAVGKAIADRKKLAEFSKEIERRVKIAKGVVELYSPKGVRARVLDTVTPYLNERTATYLGALSDGRFQATWSTLSQTAKGELREKFSIDARDTKDGGTFTDMSGGERRKVRVACALALQDMVAGRASKPIDLWIGDEIDDALDPAGLERLMGVLEDKARQHGTVLVISHSDLRDWISNTMIVRRENGVSEVLT
jgi:DNA repair exonuclease SbcCD ATPase subunit